MQVIGHLIRFSFLQLILVAPLSYVYAQDGVALAKQFVVRINQAILYPLILLMMGIALLVFLYGAFEYVMNADNESDRETGKKHLLWGIIGLMVMVSAYALLEVAANTFGVSGQLQDARSR